MTFLSMLLEKYIDVNEIIGLASSLIAIESHREVPRREQCCARRIAKVFEEWGFQPELVEVLDKRPNVYCRLKGHGAGRSLMFNGHIDTVPGHNMSFPPFRPFVKDGLLFGRGSVDMKGALACMIIAFRLLRDLHIQLQGDVIFAGVINEEDRSEGAEHLVRHGPHTDFCIIGEPTDMKIMTAHRGLEWLEFEFIGVAAHGGTPQKGVNAIRMASRFIHRLENTLVPELAKRTNPLTGPAMINYGVIQGGSQPSTVADRCILQIDRRWIPQENLQQVLDEFQQILNQLSEEDTAFKCSMKRMESNMATMDHLPMQIALDNPLVTSLQSVLTNMGIKPAYTNAGGWTDAALLGNYAHIPTVVFGPGDVEVAHSRCEYVPVEQLKKCTQVYALLAAEICNQVE